MLVYRLSAGGKEKKRHQVSHDEKKYGSNNCFFGTTTYKDAPTWFIMERIVATGADDSADKQQQQFGQLETRERRV